MKRALSRKNLWEATPAWLKSCLTPIVHAVPPAWWLGRRFRENLEFVHKAERWSAEQAREYQLTHLRRICTLAYEKTDYYRQTFRQAGFEPGDLKTPEDLGRLPTIDKKTLLDHLNTMCTQSTDTAGIDYVSTGGSSGSPLHFYIDAGRSAVEYAYLYAGWERVGYRLDIPQAVFRGQIVPEDRTGLRHQYDPILRRHFYSNFHMSDENMRRYLEHVSRIGTCFLHTYPSSIAALARFVQCTRVPVPPNILGILAGSENVYAEDRAIVEKVFGVRCCSWYGHSEKLVLAAECEHSADYHVWPTYGYCELIDEAGKPVTTPGQRGEIVGTGFINTVMPFIRYRTGDYATYRGAKCDACGRQQMLIGEVEGRGAKGCLVGRDGGLISMTAFNVHDDMFENVGGYQFAQSEPGRATMRLVALKPLSAEHLRKLQQRVNERLQGQVDVTLEVVQELEKTQRGKELRVVQSCV